MHIFLGTLAIISILLKINWFFVSPEDKNEIEMDYVKEKIRKRKQRHNLR